MKILKVQVNVELISVFITCLTSYAGNASITHFAELAWISELSVRFSD